MSTKNKLAVEVVQALTRAAGGTPVRTLELGSARFPSLLGLPKLPGSNPGLEKVAPEDLGQAVTRALDVGEPRRLLVGYAGNLVCADTITGMPSPSFFGDLAPELLQYSIDRSVRSGSTDWQGRTDFLGDQTWKGDRDKWSLNYRALRVGKGLMTMAAELLARGFTQAQVEATLRSPLWRDAAVEFVRACVMEAGFEHAVRFEFRTMLQLQDLLATPRPYAFSYQRAMPIMSGRSLNHGVDVFLHWDGRAFQIELKAYLEPDKLVGGTLTFPRKSDEEGSWYAVKGSELTKQIAAGILRLGYWNHIVPGPGVDWDIPVPPLFPSGWSPVASTSVGVIDDLYVVDHLMGHVNLALDGTTPRLLDGENVIDFGTLREPIRRTATTLLAEAIRPEGRRNLVLVVDDLDVLRALALRTLLARFPTYQQVADQCFALPNVVERLGGRVQRIRLVGGSQGPAAIVQAAGAPP
jgi:hypothetical protein